ncbi:MAG TPA: thioredoxin, partial [Prosthecobacter sp.]|nr:thioredoxin [Prosthecobacter sp.]
PRATAGRAQAVHDVAQAGHRVRMIEGHAGMMGRGTVRANGKIVIDSPATSVYVVRRLDNGPRNLCNQPPTPMASEAVIALNESNFQSEIKNSDVPVLVDFWAEWCGPCRMLTPILDQLATEKAGAVKIAKVNVDESPSLAQQFGVRSIPMLVFFKNGEARDTVVGVQSKDALAKKLDALA